MNYYAPMTHHHIMSEETQFYNPSYFTFPTNRFIYVKQNFISPTPKVLVNPHFKKKVYVNPQFKLSHNPVPLSVPSKPKIHVNPNILKSFATTNNVPKTNMKQETEAKSTVISTRNKLVRVPCSSADKLVRKRRNSLHTKYKIVRSTSVKSGSLNKFKLDKRPQKSLNTSQKSIKKKYVYVNRFLSINVMAKNILLKKNSNLSKPGFVNINGILYKKSPNSLRKASDTSLIKSRPTSSKYNLVRKKTEKTSTSRRSIVKRYKLTRSKKLVKVTPSKLKKCNIPCPVYRKFGKCKGKENGTCIKLHNPNQIVLCTRFLQGACLNENCLLSHKVSPEKMPTCKYFLEGLCSRDDCPYLHVKISPKADICKDFLEGFCKQGAECNKRHQFLCPDFEKNKACPRRRCPYPHGNLVRKSKVLNVIAKKCSATKKVNKLRRKVEKVEPVKDAETRYYKDRDLDVENSLLEGNEPVIKTVSKNRPKLGELPAFIPFFETT